MYKAVTHMRRHQAGNLEEAFDALCDEPERPLPAEARFRRSAMRGLLRHAQWAAMQPGVVDNLTGEPGVLQVLYTFICTGYAQERQS